MERLLKTNADKVGTPVHHSEIDVDDRFEDTSVVVRGLEPNRTWIFLGFVYSLIPGIQHSLFERYNASVKVGEPTVDVKTVQLENPICYISEGFRTNPWAYKVQGIRQSFSQRVIDFMASFRFHRNAEDGFPEVDYRIDFEEVRMADPTITDSKRAVSVFFGKPVNLTTKRTVAMLEAPGLLLRPPKFHMTKLAEVASGTK